MQHAPTIVRAATAADSAQLWRLAHVNGTRRLRGTVLVAERGGAVIGAIELKTGTVIGDQPYSDNEDTRLLQRWRYLDAVRPDITFFGNVPYISWIEPQSGVNRGFVGHFENGVFQLDTPRAIRFTSRLRSAPVIDARVPLSSSCTSDPFTNDGAACPVAAVNAPFDLFTTAESPQRLFSQAIVGGPNSVLFPGLQLAVDQQPDGAVISSTLGQSNDVGILVQRIAGSRHVHGKRVLVTKAVGRVPLGHHLRGSLKIHWDLKVAGHSLKPGKYLVTLRALDRHRNVLGLGGHAIVKVS